MPKNSARNKKRKPSNPTAQGKILKSQPEELKETASHEEPATSLATRVPLGFAVVGVGASAGGLEAFTELLRNIPEKCGMAFVLVQHLDPKHVSTLSELLAQQCKLPVHEAADGIQVEVNHVYVIPRNSSISIAGGKLVLSPRDAMPGNRTGIDTFLQSLADDQGSQAVGVVLSGNGSDGCVGLRAIKSAGGITFAQDPATAKFDGMPRSAIASECVDFVRAPAKIATELLKLMSHPFVQAWAQPEELLFSQDWMRRVFALVRAATGVDLTYYKASTIRRRIRRRMVLKRAEDPEGYLAILRADSAEVTALYEDTLIHVTEFFRDPEVFAYLETEIFPRIMQAQANGMRQIRMWVPGCSTGEEAYSLAMALLEFLGPDLEGSAIQIFATDVSERAVERARAGVYPASIANSVGPERLRRFFVRADSGYQVQKSVREICVFARHNVAKDPPFSRLDLISCRNVLIYFGPQLQQRILPTFHYALKPSGFLLLGTSETVSSHPDMFRMVDNKHKVYARKPAPSRLSLEYPVSEPVREPPEVHHAPLPPESGVQNEADRMVLAKYAPPGMVVDQDLNILQFRGQTNMFVDPSAGAASLNALRMVKQSLASELKSAVAKAAETREVVHRSGLRLTNDRKAAQVNLVVLPLRSGSNRERKFLILFEPITAEQEAGKAGAKKGARPSGVEQENGRLRRELTATKEYLQSIIEDQEAAHEELRSASEEIQSSNEELQSTNEELETAKEELQSTNEELNTVNEELQNRNLQLAQVGNDLSNVLANVNIPIVIVGNDLRIRRFTPITEKVLNLIPADIGRPIRDINLYVIVKNVDALLLDVLETLTPKVLNASDVNGRQFSVRIRPYRTEDNKIDGVVMVFVDVDPLSRGDIYSEPAESMAVVSTKVYPREHSLHGGDGKLRSFAAALLHAQEEERRRLSRELHDELNQKLALLQLNIENLENRSGGTIDGELQVFRRTVSDLSDDLRRIAYQLHPSVLEDLGLTVALHNFCEEFSSRMGIQVRFTATDVPGNLPSLVSMCLYRVVQEALRNVAKHSGAKRAMVTLAGNEQGIELSVRDAGSGFDRMDPRRVGSLGMVGMEERMHLIGGTVDWKSKPGKGTLITVRVPAEALEESDRELKS